MHFTYLNPTKSAVFKDRFVTKVGETIVPFEKGRNGEVGLIGLPSSKSSISLSMAANAPESIRKALNSFSTYSATMQHDFRDERIVDFGDVPIHPTSVSDTIDRLHLSIQEMLQIDACNRYIMLGGDHGISYPSIHAFQKKYGTIGVIQWDAHHDVRNLEDGGRTNGTPFRSLLEEGIIKGEHLVQVGIRNYSNAEAYDQYANEKGIHVYMMEDIEEKGILPIIEKEVERLSSEVDFIYLSVDMDSVDQAHAPGCPAIGPGGFTSRELLSSIKKAAEFPKTRAMDIVEIDPSQDVRDMTSRLAAHVMMKFMYKA
ncbi:formimidoylglutamase [Pontibacillus yanchengensis]|uniref:Formimidoylglutamase n=2 Tax=Pontibacillus yanchengensis TaxID=462910 RepID=A0ACC7VC64_9BACI|nr:formimidoylglutamase [Pontibacillus yanchengensis]MYL35348.1 formimidoylglutamase [Pontibacillus yanchengensis]MYL52377.1 formimidoylglutamase [Pontibacillus yanchengensis]